MRYKRSCLQITLVVSIVLAFGHERALAVRSSVPTWELTFKGTASGGTLVLAKNLNRTVKHVSIQTVPGETAESVARRLADTINWHVSMESQTVRYDKNLLWVGGYQVAASGPTLKLPREPGAYMLAGTETGLGIPKPPLFLSCSYDEEKDEVVLFWTNPPGGYDFVIVRCYWTDFDNIHTERLLGTATSFTIDRKRVPVNVGDMDFRIIGFRENIPSNAAAIHVSGHSQEELYGVPFFDGIAPNWTTWASRPRPNAAAFEEGERYPTLQGYNAARALLTKPFYQVIKAPPQGAEHGVYRKFLGLTPGHTYRITACLNTLEMDSIKSNWSFSLCATHNGPDGKTLTDQQLAGLAALPDKSRGPHAGRMASYAPGNTTRGAFELLFSGGQVADAPQSSHITLPPGANTITVWVRFNCSDPKGKVGFSGVKLEDISAIGNPKSPDRIMEEEHRHEMKMLKWIDRESRQASRAEPQLK